MRKMLNVVAVLNLMSNTHCWLYNGILIFTVPLLHRGIYDVNISSALLSIASNHVLYCYYTI